VVKKKTEVLDRSGIWLQFAIKCMSVRLCFLYHSTGSVFKQTTVTTIIRLRSNLQYNTTGYLIPYLLTYLLTYLHNEAESFLKS